jgi:hypothetical protein
VKWTTVRLSLSYFAWMCHVLWFGT